MALLGDQSDEDRASPQGRPNFQTGLMGNAYRPSVNIQQDRMDPLIRFFLEAGAFMPDDLRQEQGRPKLSPADRGAMIEVMNNHRSYVDPGNDLMGMGRMQPIGPSHPTEAPPDVLNALLTGPSLNAPSFSDQVNDALFQQSVGGPLSGQPASQDAATSALATAVGSIDPNLIARLYGQRGQ